LQPLNILGGLLFTDFCSLTQDEADCQAGLDLVKSAATAPVVEG
jgi:hypothetical protein